jgi:hypothetical protein
LTEEDHNFILMIGGINISLRVRFEGAPNCEEVMQEASIKDTMGPNVCKYNILYTVGTEGEVQPTMTVVEEEKMEYTLTSSQVIKEEENSGIMLTQWEMELKMLEDWLCNPDM